MNKLLRLGTTGVLLLACGSSATARSHHHDPVEAPPEPPAPVLQLPSSSALPATEPAPLGEIAPALPPPPVVYAPTFRTRKYWELSAIGGAALGGIYVLSIFAGSMSYAGFYQGQWGWFVPVIGPMLTMGGAGGKLCSCTANLGYTYAVGSLLTLTTLGALVPVVLGGVLHRTVPTGPNRLQLAPTIATDSTGLVVSGRF